MGGKLYRICWQTIFVSEIRQAVDTVRICLVSRTFLTPTGAASHAGLVGSNVGHAGKEQFERLMHIHTHFCCRTISWQAAANRRFSNFVARRSARARSSTTASLEKRVTMPPSGPTSVTIAL